MTVKWLYTARLRLPLLMITLVALIAGCGAPAATEQPAATQAPPAATQAAPAAEPTTAPAEPTTAPPTAEPTSTEEAATPTSELVEIAPAETAAAADGDELEGEVTINFQSNDTQTWEAVAKAYMAKHPKVKVNVELKPSEGYQEWIRAQFAAGTPKSSLVNGNVVADLINEKKFLDLSPFLDRESPYTNQPWRQDMDETSVANMRTPVTGEMYTLNLETVQVLWFYNIDAFQKAGILEEAQTLAKTDKNQPTWSQLINWCGKLKEAGYTPVAIEGDFRSFWEIRMGWLARMYLDQFTRDEAELVRAQPGDWNFRDGIDDKWNYDPSDPHNDDGTQLTFNTSRKMLAFKEGKQRVDGPEFRELYTNLKQFNDKCAPDGWLGVSDAYPLFLTQKAAIRLDGAWLLTSFEKDIRSLAEGKYISGSAKEGEPTPTPLPEQPISTFELGSFNNPTMEGDAVDAPARTIEVNIGFWSIPKKDQAQNDLEIDFLMYLTSPEGYGIYLKNKLDANNPQGGINGPPIVKNVDLPGDFAERFAQLKLIGNTEKDTAGTYRARGIADYQPSVREWVDLSQQYFTDKITLDDFLTKYQASLERLWPEILEHMQLTEDDLKTPEKKPASQQ